MNKIQRDQKRYLELSLAECTLRGAPVAIRKRSSLSERRFEYRGKLNQGKLEMCSLNVVRNLGRFLGSERLVLDKWNEMLMKSLWIAVRNSDPEAALEALNFSQERRADKEDGNWENN